MESLAIICFSLIMYSIGNIILDYFSRYYQMYTLADIYPLMIISSIVVSIFSVYPLYLLKYHKSIEDTIIIYLILVFTHFYVSMAILHFTPKKFKMSNYSTKYHIIHMVTLSILVFQVLR